MMNLDTIFFDAGNTLFFYNYEFLGGLLTDRFDIDINLLKLEESHRLAQKEVVESGILSRGHEEVWYATYRRWFKFAGLDRKMSEGVIDAIRNHPFNHLFWTKMDEEVPRVLDWFRERGFKLGVISNAEGQIHRVLEHVGVDSKFEVVADSGAIGIAKPEHGIFKHALDAIGSDAANSIHVGDLYDIDVVGARKAGMTPILIDRHNSGDLDCLTVTKVVDLPKLDIFEGL